MNTHIKKWQAGGKALLLFQCSERKSGPGGWVGERSPRSSGAVAADTWPNWAIKQPCSQSSPLGPCYPGLGHWAGITWASAGLGQGINSCTAQMNPANIHSLSWVKEEDRDEDMQGNNVETSKSDKKEESCPRWDRKTRRCLKLKLSCKLLWWTMIYWIVLKNVEKYEVVEPFKL